MELLKYSKKTHPLDDKYMNIKCLFIIQNTKP